MDAFETRLSRLLVAASEPALRRVDPLAEARAIGRATQRGWRARLGSGPVRLVWVGVAALLLLGLALWLIGRSPRPTMAPFPIAINRNDGDIYVLGADRRPVLVARRDPSIGVVSLMRWSPDHTLLGISRPRDAGTEILIVTADGHHAGSIKADNYAWSPDGAALATWNPDDPHELRVVGLEGALRSTLALPGNAKVRFLSTDGYIEWSPDGTTLALPACTDCDRKAATRILLVAADGSGTQWLTPDDESWDPEWSADGRLAWIRGCFGGSSCTPGVAVRSPDGSVETVPIHERTTVASIEWSPDGLRLAIVTNDLSGAATTNRLEVWSGTRLDPIEVRGLVGFFNVTWASNGSFVINGWANPDVACASLWSLDAAGGDVRLIVSDACESDGRDN